MMIEVKEMKYLLRYLKKEPLKVGIVIILTIITSALRVTHALINVNILNSLIKLQLHNFFNWVMIDIDRVYSSVYLCKLFRSEEHTSELQSRE